MEGPILNMMMGLNQPSSNSFRGLNNTKNMRVWSMKYQPTSFWSWTVLFIDFLMKIIHKTNFDGILMGFDGDILGI